MVWWKVVLILLAAITSGFLVGLFFISMWQRARKKRAPRLQEKPDIIQVGAWRAPLTQGSPGSAEGQTGDALDVLLRNRAVTLSAENRQAAPALEALREPAPTKQQDLTAAAAHASAPAPAPAENAMSHPESNPLAVGPQNPSAVNLKSSRIMKPNVPIVPEPNKLGKPAPEVPATMDKKKAAGVGGPTPTPAPAAPMERTTSIPQSTSSKEKPEVPSLSGMMKELASNLVIAITPWADRLLAFQTSSWEATHGGGEPLLADHFEELIQLYVDINLANNIVWLATEIGHRSKDLDAFYLKLCSNIAERIRQILPPADGAVSR